MSSDDGAMQTHRVLSTPSGNMPTYNRIVAENIKTIRALLNQIKQVLSPQYVQRTYSTRGRIMPHMISRAAISGSSINNVYYMYAWLRHLSGA